MIVSDEEIRLAPFEPEDADIYRSWVNDEALSTLLGRALPVSLEQHEAWYRQTVQDPKNAVFAVRTLKDDRYLGNVWLHNIHWINRNAELRILLGEAKVQGRGYGTRACRLLLKFAFAKLGLNKVYLYVSARNPRAKKAFEKSGFREEGLLREEFFLDGEFSDVVRMAVLRSQWSV